MIIDKLYNILSSSGNGISYINVIFFEEGFHLLLHFYCFRSQVLIHVQVAPTYETFQMIPLHFSVLQSLKFAAGVSLD